MKNSENPQIISILEKGLWDIMNKDERILSHLSYDQKKELVNLYQTSIPEKVKTEIDKMQLDISIPAEVTVEITTKKKGRILTTDFYHKDLKGKILPIASELHKYIHYKQLIAFRVYPGENILKYWDNGVPKNVCCNKMRDQFTFCSNHGLNCPDYFIRCRPTGEFQIHADNRTYAISNCPFCGKPVNQTEEQRQGVVINLI